MKAKAIEIGVVVVVLLLFALVVVGCDEEPEYQTSEYEWSGHYLSLLRKVLPEDTDLGGWKISCPKCAGSPNLLRLYEVTIKRKVGAVAKIPHKWYCSECLYPLGTDWNISIISQDFEKLEQAHTISIDAPGVTIIGGKF